LTSETNSSRKPKERRVVVRSREVIVLLVAGVVLSAVGVGTAVAQGTGATAQLQDAEGNAVGTAEFTEVPGGVLVAVRARGLDPGEHGIHLHETGACDDPPAFDSAGGHINPAGAQHGLENPRGPHAGDLPDLSVAADGTAAYEATTDRVTLSGSGAAPLLDGDGSALVVHAAKDDQVTDPTGNSGDRVACGVIGASTVAGQALPDSGGVGVVPLAALGAAASAGVAIIVLRRALRG
jgi:Cu-Zn family superoxide dismutase